jgi:hypothetical protein
MAIDLVTWKIRGLKPLMQNSWRSMLDEDDEPTSTTARRRGPKVRSPRFEEAKSKLWQTENGRYFHAARAFWAALVGTCPGTSIGKTAASSLIPKAVDIAEEEFILLDPDTLDAKKPRPLSDSDWVVDTRPAVNAQKGAILVSRPKWKRWGGLLVLEVNRDVIPAKYDDVITQLLNNAGLLGVGSGRTWKKPGTSQWYSLGMGKFTAELRK